MNNRKDSIRGLRIHQRVGTNCIPRLEREMQERSPQRFLELAREREQREREQREPEQARLREEEIQKEVDRRLDEQRPQERHPEPDQERQPEQEPDQERQRGQPGYRIQGTIQIDLFVTVV
ncbi:hypothetical protein EDC94DRAFT_582040 [Helicostylum pulchrum]|nr:hypothetical protein EDC94DRAFT_582040 [Helicostylum pulchrum]